MEPKNRQMKPSKEEQYNYVRLLADCYLKNDFDELFPLLADNVERFSQLSYWNDFKWKDNVINYFKRLAEKWKKVWDANYSVFEIIDLYHPMETWLSLLYGQYIEWNYRHEIITLDYNEDGKITNFCSWVPGLLDYLWELYLPDKWKQIDWGKWIPKYEKNDVMRDEELCHIACDTIEKYLKKEWYERKFRWDYLNFTPNFIVNKDWDKTAILVRWYSTTNDKKELNIFQKEWAIKWAKHHWSKVYFAPVIIWSKDKERREQWLLLRWDSFNTEFNWLIPF